MTTNDSTAVEEETTVVDETANSDVIEEGPIEEEPVSGDGAVVEAEEPASEHREYESVRTLVEFEDSEIVEKAKTAATLQSEVKSLELSKKEKNDKYKSAIDDRTNSIKSLLSQIGEGGTFQNVECYVVKNHDDEVREYYSVDGDKLIKTEPFGFADRQRGLFELEQENGRREEKAEWDELATTAKKWLFENDCDESSIDDYSDAKFQKPFGALSGAELIEIIQSFDPEFGMEEADEFDPHAVEDTGEDTYVEGPYAQGEDPPANPAIDYESKTIRLLVEDEDGPITADQIRAIRSYADPKNLSIEYLNGSCLDEFGKDFSDICQGEAAILFQAIRSAEPNEVGSSDVDDTLGPADEDSF